MSSRRNDCGNGKRLGKLKRLAEKPKWDYHKGRSKNRQTDLVDNGGVRWSSSIATYHIIAKEINIMDIGQLLITAMLIEAVWETGKMVWQDGKLQIDRIGTLVIGLVMAFALKLDLMDMMGMTTFIPYVGTVMTGILISRGSSYVHDIANKLQQ